jgi:hypothetical protein
MEKHSQLFKITETILEHNAKILSINEKLLHIFNLIRLNDSGHEVSFTREELSEFYQKRSVA